MNPSRYLFVTTLSAALVLGQNQQKQKQATDWNKPFPSHKIIGNLYFVGTDNLGTFLITTALAGIGLSLRPADMRKAGRRPLLLGALLWGAVAASSLGLQALTGTI